MLLLPLLLLTIPLYCVTSMRALAHANARLEKGTINASTTLQKSDANIVARAPRLIDSAGATPPESTNSSSAHPVAMDVVPLQLATFMQKMMVAGIPQSVQGALVGIFGSTLTACGLVLQKHSHVVNSGGGRPYVLQKWWILGFTLFFLAQIISLIPMAMTPQLVTAYLGSWTMVCNAIFAKLILKETLTTGQIVATAGLVLSTVLVILETPQISKNQHLQHGNVEQLASRFIQPSFLALTGFYIWVIGFTWIVGFGVRACPESESSICKKVLSFVYGGSSIGDGTAAAVMSACRSVLVPTLWTVNAAVCVGYTTLILKCVACIIAGSLSGERHSSPWHTWHMYAILAAGLACAPLELHWLNSALSSGDAVFVVSLYGSLGILTQLSMGAVFFRGLQEFASEWQEARFGIGVLCTLTFVIVMTVSQARKIDAAARASAAASKSLKRNDALIATFKYERRT